MNIYECIISGFRLKAVYGAFTQEWVFLKAQLLSEICW